MKKKVAEFNAIEDISFFVRKGETLGIVGESGCGKTTLARTIMRMYEPDKGEINIFGTDISKMKPKELVPYRKNMAMVFQDPSSSLDPRKTAGESVAEPMIIHKIYDDPAEMSDRVDELFTLVGLDPMMRDRFPHNFSGGQRQRIGVARALASNPSILLLDEPISALDVSIQAQVINTFEDLQKKLGIAYLFIAHDIGMVKHISNRIGVMYMGHLVELGESGDLFSYPLHPYTRALLSAIPIPDPVAGKSRKRILLRGELPSPVNPPPGCPFRQRCPFAMDICGQVMPEMKQYGSRQIACHQVEKEHAL
jgi:oligopeptide/dipeptide ABC transporter ATP-binding protein